MIKKLGIILIILQFLGGCVATPILWSKNRTNDDKIENYVVDKQNKKIILLGEVNPKTKQSMNYSITDQEGEIARIIDLQVKYGGELNLEIASSQPGKDTDYVYLLSDSKIEFGVSHIGFFLRKNLTDEDKKIIYNYHNSKVRERDQYIDFGGFSHVKATRYPSSEEKFTNFCSSENKTPNCSTTHKFKIPLKEEYWRDFTPSETATRLVATPFAIAVDVVLLPFYLLTYIAVSVMAK
jgi:hypothetical protein